MSVHHNTMTPKCPHCGHEMDSEEMCYGKPTCDVTPPYPFRPSIEAAHAIRALKPKEPR